ncbi:unnamed protein product [Paramecium sonneborni]|uniref:Uncharacterized protein n=1 Tax=Paramecium sonneborni TaxID=65129 RepID=A0A8S1MIJ5_9CILI|nr:unnamed protein product [Paramecium sonneborni]CAD8080437.1 unnamed protein product [Paramecium sonneborni]
MEQKIQNQTKEIYLNQKAKSKLILVKFHSIQQHQQIIKIFNNQSKVIAINNNYNNYKNLIEWMISMKQTFEQMDLQKKILCLSYNYQDVQKFLKLIIAKIKILIMDKTRVFTTKIEVELKHIQIFYNELFNFIMNNNTAFNS